ncbi:hypothetical protein F2Q68_00043852 [Brassica cretica]|uniref:Uncharacterized protein n=2 Tax=Brassica cretica TaxID=69181 RepID=A0ABQ7B2X6_BRACR|nr:hypothetical protein F2Q68_00043852 [Brassica cretica]KAF3520648.1 hypothetical protein DY000_02059742 [Brassica cretica]
MACIILPGKCVPSGHASHEVVLAVCSKDFGSWMVAHAMELWTAVSDEGEVLAHEEQQNLGGINMEDLHRLDYAQVFLLML